jgi:cation diffusion facilitator CzcD-associated flavoprotein CzcO
MDSEHFDVLIIGAGISGIGAGYHLQKRCPGKTYAILEARDNPGGTWDLFKYPGIRSDSDMHTLGYAFKPWTRAESIAGGESILAYLKETASEFGIDRHIRYRQRARRASWRPDTATWTVDVESGAGEPPRRYTCGFLYMCAGYYDYAHGYTPEFPGQERFRGRIVHPQEWTGDIDHAGKRVVIIGSGATAVTLLPALARKASHVTMLQRSPGYLLSWPRQDRAAKFFRRYLPSRLALALCRWQYLLLPTLFFRLCRLWPALAKRCLIGLVRRKLGAGHDIDKDFTPRYRPWDQRLCLVLDDDFFLAIKDGSASVVTDRICNFTETGIALESGRELAADLIVTATGLNLQMLGGVELYVDDAPVDIGRCLQYKGAMFSDIPNLASCFGYVNASWTLKAELISEYVCRILRHMDATGMRQCTPRIDDPTVGSAPFVDFSSGYFQRAADRLPRQGTKRPWKLHQNYPLDIAQLRFGRVDDGSVVFSNPASTR